MRLPNDKIIKPGPSSEYIFKQCTLHVCSGLLMWTVFFFYFILVFFFLKKKGKSCMHACLGCMYACFTFIRSWHIQVDFQRMEMVSSSTNVWKKVCFSSEFSLVKCVCACVIPWIPNLKTDWWQTILSWSKYHYDRSPFCVFCLRTFFLWKH